MNEVMNPYLWRQHREDIIRQAGRDRLVRALRADRKRRTFLWTWELERLSGLLLKSLRRQGSRKGGHP
jgi:hypothetical protein